MAALKDDNYLLIQGWMLNKLNLKGNELFVYALVYGFSQDGGVFKANRQYIAEWIGTTRKGTVSDIMKRLESKGLIEVVAEGEYRAIVPDDSAGTISLGSTESVPSTEDNKGTENVQGSTETVRGSTESVPKQYGKRTTYKYNKYIYNYINKEGNRKPTEECLKLCDSWFKYREKKRKGIDNDITAERLIEKFIKYYDKYGADKIMEVINYSVENAYTGLFFERLDKPDKKTKPEATKSESSYDLKKFAGIGVKAFDILSED